MAYTYEMRGTVSVQNGSVTVTGSGTAWFGEFPGLSLNLDGLEYPIAEVVDGSTLTLAKPYTGPTASGLSYILVANQANNYELYEKFSLLMGSGGNSGGGNNGGGTTPGFPTLSISSPVSKPEGNSGTTPFLFTLTLVRNGSTLEYPFTWAVSASGTNPADKEDFGGAFPSGSGTFAAGETSKTITVLVKADTVVEPHETFTITVTAPGLSTVSQTGTIRNDDTTSAPGGGGNADLSGDAAFYAGLNKITPLGLDLNGSTASLTLQRDSGLKLLRKFDDPIVVDVASTWLPQATSPYAVTGEAVPASMTMQLIGTASTFAGDTLTINKDTYLRTPSLGLEFSSSSDAATSQTPPKVGLEFSGNVPPSTNKGVIMGSLQHWGTGFFRHVIHWSETTIEVAIGREGFDEQSIQSDSVRKLTGEDITVRTEWLDNPNGAGGTVYFYVNGEQYGAPKPTTIKPRIGPASDLQVNATVNNANDSVDGLLVRSIKLELGKPAFSTRYEEIADGPVSREEIENLCVDGRNLFIQQPARYLTYTANGSQTFTLAVVVGDMLIDNGKPYKVVLQNWSTGSGVVVGEHIMTKPLMQNCRFEDSIYYSANGSWTEIGSQGAPIIIDGIAYGCEGFIHEGNTTYRFVYWNDRPSEPFGDPEGLNTYMVPHKWVICDKQGTVLDTIEGPDGLPLNDPGTTPIWDGGDGIDDLAEGDYDGRNVPLMTDTNRWKPHGTTRCAIVWEEVECQPYSQQFIFDNVPVYDQRVEFASFTSSSTNGFDLRIACGGAGGDGQMNGFANWQAMPYRWGSETYDSIQEWGTTTKSRWKNLYLNPYGLTPNVALALEYYPFNNGGRCPIVGPGGTRDDRQIMTEVVARFARDITSVRAHDEVRMVDIARAALKTYASDPFNAVVNGKITPLFKGNMRRAIRMRNHYYGYGEATTPEDQAWYANVGRLDGWTRGLNPTRAAVPYAGNTPDKPYFGGFEIDTLHAHQFPAWGSQIFKTPLFAMLQVNYSDQAFMYQNDILGDFATSITSREQAWKFMHCALLWKTASKTSTYLYTRDEVLDRIKVDFELFWERCYASTPGFMNPPTNVLREDGSINGDLACMAMTNKLGPCYVGGEQNNLELSEFQAGYWLSALHAAQKIGFLDAVRALSPKCKNLVNWLIRIHGKHVLDRINTAIDMNMDGSDYQIVYWRRDDILAVNGDISQLPQTIAEAADKYGRAPSWDIFTYVDKGVTKTASRDGQAMDALLAGPALLKDLGFTDPGLAQAIATAETLFQQKLASETSKGTSLAGDTWFRYHQSTNNRAYSLAAANALEIPLQDDPV